MNADLLSLAGVLVCIKDCVVQEDRIIMNMGKCYQVKRSGFDMHIRLDPNHPGHVQQILKKKKQKNTTTNNRRTVRGLNPVRGERFFSSLKSQPALGHTRWVPAYFTGVKRLARDVDC